MKLLSKLIRTGYKVLGTANTANTLMSGNPKKIAKHLARKRTVKFGSRLIK